MPSKNACVMLDQAKKHFLLTEAASLAVAASVRECSQVYIDSKSPQSREAKEYWKRRLENLGRKYQADANREFDKDVLSLQKAITKKYGPAFFDCQIRIAQCHKSLSVYIKWLWCTGYIKNTPPSCPFDRQIIRKAIEILQKQDKVSNRDYIQTLNDNISWSSLNDKKKYLKILNALDRVSEIVDLPIAEWELREYK